VSVFHPAPAATDGLRLDRLPVDSHSQEFQDDFHSLEFQDFRDDSRSPAFRDDFHSLEFLDDSQECPDDFHSLGFPGDSRSQEFPVYIPEFLDATLPAGFRDFHLDGPDDNPDSQADPTQDGCTPADSPTSVVDS
jgi:hypothetical protein